MNSPSDGIPVNGNLRRKSIGSGDGTNLDGGKTRRYSVGVTSFRKSIGEEGSIVPNYLRASTGSCHDFCKFGKKHELSKSAIPRKFNRTKVVYEDKLLKTVVSLEKKNTIIKPSINPKIQTPDKPVKVTKNDVLLPSMKPQSYERSSSTNGKKTKNEVKSFQRSTSLVKSSPVKVNSEMSNGGIEKKDTKAVKKTGIIPKTGTVKKVVTKVTPNESHSQKGSFSRAASLKAIKSRGVKRVSPLKDQNRMMQKAEPKQTIDDSVHSKSLHGVEAESEVKPETMEFDFTVSSIEFVNPPVCTSEESPIIHLVYESSEVFSDKEIEELFIVESSQLQSCPEKVISEEELIAPHVAESPESFNDDEVLENESDYTDDEEVEVLEDGSETTNINEMETSVENHKIPRKGKTVISEYKDDEAVRLRFRRGKVLDLQTENNGPRRLKFRRVINGNGDGQNISRKTYKNKTLDLQSEDKQLVFRRNFDNKHAEETNDSKNGPESVVLKHQGEQEKKDAQGLLNNVIEETASKLVESRKSKVKALVGAFETVISLQDSKPSSA